MEWSPLQDRALSETARWLRQSDGPPIFRLFGYAGTGKTTLARHLAEGVDGEVLFAAYTGKAAHVLRQKGCPASTIHSLIYCPKDKSQIKLKRLEADLGELRHQLHLEGVEAIDERREVQELEEKIREERRALARPAFTLNLDSPVRDAEVVVIDECSMVDERMGQDLLSFGVKVLVLGDPAQLPPVRGGGFFTDHEPDVMLTEVHRQAKESPIIALATAAREERALPLGPLGDSAVVESVEPEIVREHDQILVGRNRTRHSSNARMRELLGRDGDLLPMPEDKLVCLRNNHDLGLLNGSLWTVIDSGHVSEERVYLHLQPRDSMGPEAVEIEAWTFPFLTGDTDMSWWDRREAEEFDYGYALTVHKAQGSQWGSVVLFDESRVFRGSRWRWLYTGITRAADRVTVVKR